MSFNQSRVSRVSRSKLEAIAAYNRLSRCYDLLARRSEKKFTEIGLQKLEAKEGEVVLEIGFGTGHALVELARSVGPSGCVHGIDISSGMAAVARRRIKEAEVSQRVGLVVGDALSLPFKAQSFDAIFMSFTLELFDTPEIEVVLLECRRVLLDEGRICVVAMSKAGEPNRMTRLYEWAHEKFPAYIDCRPIFAGKDITDAGFVISEIAHGSMWGIPVEVILAEKGMASKDAGEE